MSPTLSGERLIKVGEVLREKGAWYNPGTVSVGAGRESSGN